MNTLVSSSSFVVSNLRHLMFLPKDQWSPRYEETFYSVKLEGFEKLTVKPPPTTTCTTATATSTANATIHLPPGNASFPAYYYRVTIYRGHQTNTVLRRYSQFKWLYDELRLARPSQQQQSTVAATATTAIHTTFPVMPPGTCPWDRPNDAFAACRHDELADLLTALLELQLPGTNNASHPAVVAFLELQ